MTGWSFLDVTGTMYRNNGNHIICCGVQVGVLALWDVRGLWKGEDKTSLSFTPFVAVPFRFIGLFRLLNLSHSQSSWPQRCDCGGGHYGSALGAGMTRVTDDIREPHSPRQSPKLLQPQHDGRASWAGRVSPWAAVILILSELVLSKLQIKPLPAGMKWKCMIVLKQPLEVISKKTAWFLHYCTKLDCVLSLVIICHSALGDRLSLLHWDWFNPCGQIGDLNSLEAHNIHHVCFTVHTHFYTTLFVRTLIEKTIPDLKPHPSQRDVRRSLKPVQWCPVAPLIHLAACINVRWSMEVTALNDTAGQRFVSKHQAGDLRAASS